MLRIDLGAHRSVRAARHQLASAGLALWLVPLAALVVASLGVNLGWVPRPALIATGLSAAFWMLLASAMRIPVGYGLLYPLGAIMTLYIGARSTWRGGRRVEWRGRVYGSEARSP